MQTPSPPNSEVLVGAPPPNSSKTAEGAEASRGTLKPDSTLQCYYYSS